MPQTDITAMTKFAQTVQKGASTIRTDYFKTELFGDPLAETPKEWNGKSMINFSTSNTSGMSELLTTQVTANKSSERSLYYLNDINNV